MNSTVRKIDATTGIITTFAGNGTWGWSGDGGPATATNLMCTDMVIDKFGVMIIAGYQSNTIRKVYNSKLAGPLAPVLPKGQVALFPNPARDEVTVNYHFSDKEDGTLQITDPAGRVVVSKELINGSPGGTVTINISNLPQGLYLYRVIQNKVLICAGKLVKE